MVVASTLLIYPPDFSKILPKLKIDFYFNGVVASGGDVIIYKISIENKKVGTPT
jgi:hypothetical protein